MKLLTKDLMYKIPKRNNDDSSMVVLKFFTPWSNWTWYVTEAIAHMRDGNEYSLGQLADEGVAYDDSIVEDIFFFGYVCGLENELGYFSLNELQSVKGPWGLSVERDRSYHPEPLSTVMNRHTA